MKRTAFFTCTVTVLITSVLSYAGQNPGQNASTVIISEICFWPKSGEPEWVELKNIYPNSVDVSGWQITSGKDFNLVFPTELPLMPSQAHILIVFDGNTIASNDLSFNGDKLVVIHGPNEIASQDANKPARNVFGDVSMGECALYAAGSRDVNSIKSFVSWGDQIESSTQTAKQAISAHIWSYYNLYVKGDRVGGNNPIILKGWTLGLYDNNNGIEAREWTSFKPEDSTPGSENILNAPCRVYPGSHSLKKYQDPLEIGCNFVTGASRYRFQICSDQNCSDVVFEITVNDGTSYDISRGKLAPNTYYIRAQAIDDAGNSSKWTATNKFELKKLKGWIWGDD